MTLVETVRKDIRLFPLRGKIEMEAFGLTESELPMPHESGAVTRRRPS